MANQPFGNGVRCVGAGGVGTFRFPPVTINGLGQMATTVDMTQPLQATAEIFPGSTWYFQGWYRDPAGGGSFFNLTDGYELVFEP